MTEIFTLSDAEKHTKNRDGRALALEKEISILKKINKYGWLTARDVGDAIWPEREDPHQAARHVLRRMIRKNFIKRHKLPNGVPAYILTTSGADALEDRGIPATDGRHLRLDGQYHHRHLSNAHLIDLENSGMTKVITENEINKKETPYKKVLGAVPDGIGIFDDDGESAWFEVETSRKPERKRVRFRRIAHELGKDEMLRIGYDDDIGKIYLKNLVFISDTREYLIAIARDLAKEFRAGRLKEAATNYISFVYAEHTSGLIYEGLHEAKLLSEIYNDV